MLEQAIAKIDNEVNATTDQSVKAVGEVVKMILNSVPAASSVIANTDKTLAKCFEHMRSVAQKKKQGNCYYMGQDESIKVIKEFYGIDANTTVTAETPQSQTNEKSKSKIVDLTDLF